MMKKKTAFHFSCPHCPRAPGEQVLCRRSSQGSTSCQRKRAVLCFNCRQRKTDSRKGSTGTTKTERAEANERRRGRWRKREKAER